MPDLFGIEYLRRKLALKSQRVCTRYRFYEMKNAVQDFNISTPPNLRGWKASLGWCGKAVDTLADRLQFYEFSEDHFDLNQIYRMNHPDVLFDSAILSALIAACSFIYISAGVDGFPRLQVITGKNATGIMDPIINQKKILQRYALDHGYKNYRFYIDDGISGTTFDITAYGT